MDTKTLFDAAVDAGINFGGEVDLSDMEPIALEIIMANPEEEADLFMDAVAQLFMEKEEIAQKIGIQRLSRGLKGMHGDIDMVQSRSISDKTISVYANSFALNCHSVADAIYFTYLREAKKYVEKYIEEWTNDAGSYWADMQEGQYEDWKYEQWKDRRLEERE